MTTQLSQAQLIEAPASTAATRYETLGYIESYDAVINDDYAFVIYRATDVASGITRVQITSKGTSGAVFEPAAMVERCREVEAKAQAYFIWGYSFAPSTSDPRCIEFRVHQHLGLPAALEIYLVTRLADGSAGPARTVRVESFMDDAMVPTVPLVEAPVSDTHWRYESLGYLAAYDAVLNCDYAFVAYRELERDSGLWSVFIKSTQTTSARLEPVAMRLKARETSAHGKAYFTWGNSFEPSATDPRQIEFRVHVAEGRPEHVEVFVRLRKADGSAAAASSMTFCWPSA